MNRKWTTDKIKKEMIEWFFCFVIAYILYLFLNYYIGTVSGVKQISMKPTANEGDKLLIQRTVIFKKSIDFGDIITFVAPSEEVGKTSIEDTVITGDVAIAKYDKHSKTGSFFFNFVGIGKKCYIKRVIGVNGDHIKINEDGTVLRNGEILNEVYLKDGITSRNGAYVDVIVPEGNIFVMGDNRLQSMDSRYFGCIPIKQVDGYVISRVWPFNKMGKLGI